MSGNEAQIFGSGSRGHLITSTLEALGAPADEAPVTLTGGLWVSRLYG